MNMNVTLPSLGSAGRASDIQYQATAKSHPLAASSEVKFKGAEDTSGVVVQNSAMVERDPDTLAIQMQMQEQGATEREVNDALHAKSEAVVQAIKGLEIPGLTMKTTFHPVYPTYEQSSTRSKQRKISGYYGSYSIAVKVKTDKSDDLPKAAAKLKQLATDREINFNGPQYGLSNREEAVLEALEKAVREAKTRAERLARAGGIQLEDTPHSIEVGSAGQHYAGGGGMRAAAAMSAMAESHVAEESFQFEPIQVASPNIVVRFNKKKATARTVKPTQGT